MKSALLAVLSLAVVPASSAQSPDATPPASSAAARAATPAAAPKARATPAPVPALEGTVRSADGKPVDKALILAQATTASFRDQPAVTRTDAAGKFRLPLKSTAAQTVRVQAAGWAPATLKDVRPGAPMTVTLQKGLAIEGTVRDGNTSAPVPGATVEARDEGARVSATWEPDAGGVRATTDERGRFRIEGLARGLHSVSARLRGFNRAERDSVPTGGRVDLYLFPGATLTGVVRDGQGQPVPGTVVRAEAELRGFGPRSSPVVARADGRFELTGLGGGSYQVVARHPDFTPAWVAGVAVDRGSESDVEVVLHRGTVVSGRLVAGEDKPVSGRVAVEETDQRPVPGGFEEDLRTEAGADGQFRMKLPPGSHSLAVVAPGYAPRSVDAEVGTAGAAVDLGDIPLEPGLAIRGRVRDKGDLPVADAQLFAGMARGMGGGPPSRSEARAEPDGAFVLAGLSAGLYRVTVRAPGYAEQAKQVEAGGNTDFVLDRSGSITGLVVDDAGAPVEAFRVVARPVREMGPTAPSPKMENGTEGRFVLDDVTEGTWVVEASAPDRANGVASDVRVTAAGSTDVGRIRLTSGGIVRGLVQDAAGGAVAGAMVTVEGSSRDMWGRGGHEATSDPGGAFEIRGIAPGNVEVVARHPSYAMGRATGIEVDPTRGPAEARIVLSQGGRIEGRVSRRDGGGIAAMVYVSQVAPGLRRGPSLDSSVNTGPDGTFVVEHAPAGRTQIAVLTGSGGMMESRHMREVDVREGETTTVEFVSREILVTGHVTRSGAPAPGIRLRLMSAQGNRMMISGGVGPMSAPPSGPQRLTGVTDETGAFALIVDEPGKHFVNASTADGRGSLPSREVDIPDADSYVMDLAFAGSPVAGVVLDRETEQPVANANVFARLRDPAARGGGQGTSAADGRFALEMEPGEYRLHTSAEGYAGDATDLSVGTGPVADLRVLLSRGGLISGRVFDSTGRGLGGIMVTASAGEGLNEQGAMGHTLPDGSFRIDGLSTGPFTVAAQADLAGFAIRPGVSAGQEDVTLTLRPGGRIQLQVRGPDGGPAERAYARIRRVGGAPVSLPAFSTTSAEGVMELQAPAGEVEIEVNKEKLRARTTVSVTPGGTSAAEVILGERPAEGGR